MKVRPSVKPICEKCKINIGFSHPVVLEAPEGITYETPNQTTIVVKGSNKQQVGNLAAGTP